MPDSTPASKTAWTLGSLPDCDLVVSQPAVSGRHCQLSTHGDKYVLEDLNSTNGTFVNGYRLEPGTPVYVSSTDRITLGQSVVMPWPPSQQNTSRPAADQVLNIGRAPDNDVQLDFSIISWHHARVSRSGNQWTIEDLKSANGTAINHISNKVERAPLQPSDEIYLGSYKIAASRVLQEKKFTQGEGQFELVRFRGDRMVLGRDPSSAYPLNYPMISWQHAALERRADGIYVEDLGSKNGTYVDGVRISGKTLVRPGQEIGLGSFRFRLLEDGALAKREYIGNVTIEVVSVAVNSPGGDRLLDSISLTVFPSELIALMGPAGAGKTTFLKAINGYTRPADGTVLFNGDDLYQFYDRFRLQMSYVPQDDIVHSRLTVREALYFSAKLRTDLTDAEIEKRIGDVVTSLGIDDKKDTIIGSPEEKVLSGGQRKRVNIAMELIADAPVIFLDEPTSGLSSYDAENVIQVLKKLAKNGTTIITTIHQPSLSIFKQFDGLIMISRDRGGRGALAYFGPAHPESIEFFDPAAAKEGQTNPGKELSPELLLSGLAKKSTADWVTTYEQSRYKKLFVTDRSGKIPSKVSAKSESAVRKFGFDQWWTLVRRNFILKIRDRAQLIITMVQAPAFAILLGLVFRRLQYSNKEQFGQAMKHAVGLEFLMVIAAVWFGCNNVARDIVGEWTVFQRERMVSLKLPSYVFSKLTIAALLNLIQCLMLYGIVHLMCDLKGDFLNTLGILYLSSLVGSAVGLCVSARASTTEAAIAMLPLILLPVIALGGALAPIKELPKLIQDAAMIVPSRWAFESDLLLEAKEHHYVPSTDSNASNNNEKADPPDVETDAEKKSNGCDLAYGQFPDKPKDGQQRQYCQAQEGDPVRTPLRTSYAILGGMLVFSVGMALIFLRMRDIQ
jgi:ABC-type multidrug transport system ATPase subunit/pSer/pThr/pTyr-binding forkhead associated (FHA) protein/ABC-type multidrug transport system permease subunit